MKMSESVANLAKALAIAQGKIQGAKKDSENPFFKSSYANLASVWDACRIPLSENGLAVSQGASVLDGTVIISSLLLHESGEWLSEELPLRPMKDDPQGIGSCITYGKRFLLASMVGVAPDDDDDGNAASRPFDAKPATRPAARPAATQKVNPAEVTMLKKSVVDVCKLLNEAGDMPKWTAKRVDEFAIQEYGVKADALEIEPLRELVKKLSNKLDAVKKGGGVDPEKERQAKIAAIRAEADPVMIATEIAKHGKSLDDLPLDTIIQIHDDLVIPF